MANSQSTLSLWTALVVTIIAVAAISYFGGFGLRGVSAEALDSGLSNIAAVGGVASGLSLAGTAVLSLNSRALQALIADFGGWIRGVLFLGYSVMVVASFAAAIGTMFTSWPGAPWIASTAATIIIVGLIATAAMINSAFRWTATDLTS